MPTKHLKTIEAPTPSIAFTRDQIDLIKATVAKGATDAELQLFLYAAKRAGLDPLLKQVHAVKRWDSAAGRETMAIQTGIDGYRLVAQRTGQHMGTTDVTYDREDAEHPGWAKVIVFRQVNGEICEFPATARWNEYAAYKKDGQPMAMWKKMPYLMLGKCAESLAIRKAFPQELAGIYTFEEMEQPVGGEIPVSKPVISGSSNDHPSLAHKDEQETPPQTMPTNTPAEKPAAATRKKLKVVDVIEGQTNYDKLITLLATGGYVAADFMSVAKKNKWVSRSATDLTKIPDHELGEFLEGDNLQIVMEELEKLPRHTKD